MLLIAPILPISRPLAQVIDDLLGQAGADSGGGGDFFRGGATEAGHRAKALEERLLAVGADTGAIVEDAFGDAPLH